jgi:hypothetical protein
MRLDDATEEERSFGRRGIDKTRAAEWYGMQARLAMFDDLVRMLKTACPEGIEETCDDCGGTCSGCWVQEARALLAKLDALGEA